MTVSVDLPENMKRKLEEKKEQEYYSSMSELIREALREYLEKEEKMSKREEAIIESIKQGKMENVRLEGKAREKLEEALQ